MNKGIISELESTVKENSCGIIMRIDGQLTIYYFESIVRKDFVLDNIKKPYFNKQMDFEKYFNEISNEASDSDIISEINRGAIILNYKNNIRIIKGAELEEHRWVTENTKETSIEGGAQGFSENLEVNENLLRMNYGNSNLVIKEYSVGTVVCNRCSIAYDKTVVNKEALDYIETRLKDIKEPVIQAVNELQQQLIKGKSIIPRMIVTARPDRAVRSIAKGRVAVMLNTTPSVLIAPATFHEFMTAVDDYYIFPIPALILIIFRYLGLFITTLLPGIYVAITSYNPEFFRIQLALTITESRTGVSYPSYFEVLFMLVMMEFLIEASTRLPKTIGQAATTVGGLILGQAATQAHLVSDIMIIVVAAVAISNFMIPIQVMGLSIRSIKYIILFMASISGLYGIYIGLFALTIYLFSINSINTPYLNPVGAFTKKNIKIFFRREQSNEK